MTEPTVLLQARSPGSTGAWANITDWLRLDQPLTITRGRQNEHAQAPASTCSLTLDNGGGQFTEGNTATIGGVSLTWSRWTQLRVSINGELRFTGWLTNPDMSWPDADESAALTTVTASGVRAVLGVSPNLSPWITELYEDLNPIVWWPLDDPVGSTVAKPRVGAAQLSVVVERVASEDDPANFGASAPAWLESGTGLTLRPRISVDDTEQLTSGAAGFPRASFPAISPPFTLLWIHSQDRESGHPSLPNKIITLSSSANALMLYWYSATEMALISDPIPSFATSVMRITDGVPRVMGLSVTATTARLLDTGLQVSTTVSPTNLSMEWPPVPGLSDGSGGANGVPAGWYAHIAIVPGAMTDTDFAALRRRVEGGLGTDLEWLQRACAYAGTAAPAKLGPIRQIQRPALRGSNPAAIGEQMAAAYGGMLTDGRDGTPTLVDPRYVPTQSMVPEINLDQVDAAALRWSSDPILRVTEAGQGEGIMASRSSWPRARTDIDPGVPTAAAQARANWLVNASDVAEAPRLTGIKLDLLAMASTSGLTHLAYIHRPRVRVVGTLPSQLPGPLRTMTVEGTTEVVSVTEWTLELHTAPDPRMILGDSIQGVLGTPGDNRLGF